jgi:hypothetical protein
MEMVINNPDKQWAWDLISCNPNLTIDLILNNPNKNWNWYRISRNPNLALNSSHLFTQHKACEHVFPLSKVVDPNDPHNVSL